MRMNGIILVVAICSLFGGCGTEAISAYPDRLQGAEGQTVMLEDIEAIVGDQSLSETEKRSRLRDLGIEDQDLIDALLTLQ